MVQSVRENGPLSSTSAYPFKNSIFYIKQKVTSPKGVLDQISNRSSRDNMLKSNLTVAPTNNDFKKFRKNVLSKRREVTTNYTRTNKAEVLIKYYCKKLFNTIESYSRCVLYTKTKNTIV